MSIRYPRSVRRRYDRLAHHPDGLIVLGDALCSFNPIYGQGMTVAALEALALRDCLADSADNLAARFYAATRRELDTVWRLGAGGDLRFASVPGARPAYLRLLNRYVDALQSSTATDRHVARVFWRVNFLLDPPQRLFRPRILAEVARNTARRAATRDTGTNTAHEVPPTART
jgi:2-polyprenyl-6-methoxyphenol hydroxylase-like FAD-dependent oxidoreductase